MVGIRGARITRARKVRKNIAVSKRRYGI